MDAAVVDVVDGLDLGPGGPEDPGEGLAEDVVPKVAQVEGLIRVGARELHHDSLAREARGLSPVGLGGLGEDAAGLGAPVEAHVEVGAFGGSRTEARGLGIGGDEGREALGDLDRGSAEDLRVGEHGEAKVAELGLRRLLDDDRLRGGKGRLDILFLGVCREGPRDDALPRGLHFDHAMLP